MKSELVESADNKATIRVTFEPEEVNRSYASVLNEYRQNLKVPGFRKGKVPRNIILSRVGEDEVRDSVRERIKAAAFHDSIEELKLEVRSQNPRFIDDPLPIEDQACELTFEVPLLPEVTLPDYEDFRIPLKRVEANEKLLEQYRERLLERFVEYEDKDEPAELGDALVYDLKSTFDDGEKEAPLRHKDVLYILGRDDNLPGYDEHFVGAVADTNLTFEYVMPNDFPNKAVAGKTLILEAEVKAVRTVKHPEVTESFVKKNYKMDSLEEFDRYLRETLDYELSEEEKQYKDSVAIDHLLGRMAVNISEDMIKDETDYLVSVRERRLRAAGHSLAEMLKERNQSLDDYRQGLREEASRRLKEFLAVRAIARAKDMSVADEEMSRYTAMFMRQYKVTGKDMKKLLKNREFVNDAMMEIMRAKAIKHVAESAHFYYEDEEPDTAAEPGEGSEASEEPPAAAEAPEITGDTTDAQENNKDEEN